MLICQCCVDGYHLRMMKKSNVVRVIEKIMLWVEDYDEVLSLSFFVIARLK